MSYMRGKPFYIWPSSDALHIWQSGNQYIEFMEVSGWREDAGDQATSVAIPHKTFDELVVMRYAEMTPKERSNAERRARKKWRGNGGCMALADRVRRREADPKADSADR
jgi:hypothetical protein